MDYKFIILLVMLLGIVLFFTRELENLRKDFEDKVVHIVSAVDNNGKSIRSKIQTDIGTCINKVKTHNMECIQQIRKMNTLGSQPITNMSNHYTDSDSDAQKGAKNNIKYLSDMNTDVEKHKPEQSTYYMSDVSPPANNVPALHQSVNEKTEQKETENFKIALTDKKSVSSKDDPATEKTPVSKKKDNKMTMIQSDLNKTGGKKDETNNKSPTLLSQEDDSNEYLSQPNSNESESSSESDDDKSESNESDGDSDSPSDNNSDEKSEDDSDEESEDDSVDESDDESVEVEIDRKQSNKQIKPTVALVKELNANEYESITVGSSKGAKKGIKPVMSLSKKHNDTDSSSDESDEVSVQTQDIGNLTLEKLGGITKYKIDALKKIAKNYSIALTCKEGGGRRQLNKGELYNKIKEYLTEQHK